MAASPPYPGPPGTYGPPYPRRQGLRWVFVGIGATVVAIGGALLVVSLYPRAFGLRYGSVFPFGGGFLGVFLILWGVLILVRVAVRANRRRMYGGGRRAGMWFDPAIMEARRRYARGEITRDQLDQIVSDLRRPPGPLR